MITQTSAVVNSYAAKFYIFLSGRGFDAAGRIGSGKAERKTNKILKDVDLEKNLRFLCRTPQSALTAMRCNERSEWIIHLDSRALQRAKHRAIRIDCHVPQRA